MSAAASAPGLSGRGLALIHVPGSSVSFGLPGATLLEQALDPLPHGLEVAEAGSQRLLEVRQRVEQAVVRRPPPEHLPEALDRVELRAVGRQPLEPQVRVIPQGLVDWPPFVPG